MKRWISVLVIALLLAGCQKQAASFQRLSERLSEALCQTVWQEHTEAELFSLFTESEVSLIERGYYQSGSLYDATLLIIIECENPALLMSAINRIKTQHTSTYQWLKPEENRFVSESEIAVQGHYLLWVCAKNASDIIALFQRLTAGSIF